MNVSFEQQQVYHVKKPLQFGVVEVSLCVCLPLSVRGGTNNFRGTVAGVISFIFWFVAMVKELASLCIASLGGLVFGLGAAISVYRTVRNTPGSIEPNPRDNLYKLQRAHTNTAG